MGHRSALTGQGRVMPLKPPYVAEYGKAGRFTIWLVDGKFIRDHISVEFTDFEQHFHLRRIPRNEIWIDSSVDRAEIPFMASMAAREARVMCNGLSYAKAEGVAMKADQKSRKFDAGQTAKVKIARLGGNGRVEVYLVSGRAVRDQFDDEFDLGGHGRVYRYIPSGEIFLDNTQPTADIPFNLLHELYEYNRMGTGVPYEKAHHEASAVEHKARKNPGLYPSLLNEQQLIAGGNLGLAAIPEFKALLGQ
jgi:hypothetical protein